MTRYEKHAREKACLATFGDGQPFTIVQAKGFWRRFMGLMGLEKMPNFDGLLFPKTNSVHTCFMRFAIDVVYLSKELEIVKIHRNLKPFRFSVCRSARYTLELATGAATVHNLRLGQKLVWIDGERIAAHKPCLCAKRLNNSDVSHGAG